MRPAASLPAAVTFALALLPSGLPGQTRPGEAFPSPTAREVPAGWRFAAGGGVASASGEPAGVARAAVEKAVGTGVWLGLDWTGAWFADEVTGQSRHGVLASLTLRRWRAPVAVRLGAGVGLATVVDVDGPPTDGAGDVVIGIGDEGGGALGAGLQVEVPLARGVALAPSADVLLNFGRGSQALAGLSLRLLLAPGVRRLH